MSKLPSIVSSLVDGEEEDLSLPSKSNRKYSNNNKSFHWIISWDINETILVGDEVGGDTREDCFNKIIAKSAFVRMPPPRNEKSSSDDGAILYDYESTTALTPTHWWDGTPIDDKKEEEDRDEETTIIRKIPPLYTGWNWPEGCCPYYRTAYKRVSKTFVEHHGSMYKPLFDEITRRLTTADNNTNSQQEKSLFRNILPSFWHTINRLVEESDSEDPPVTFVFRTFGTDLPQIAQAMTAFAQGKHPDYPDFIHPEYELDMSRLYNAKWIPQQTTKDNNESNKQYYQYQLYSQEDDRLVASGDQQVLNLLHDMSSGYYVYGIRDDYNMWKSHNWEPWAGKPVWKTYSSSNNNNNDTPYHHHHLLLDDNIHNLKHDGIASVRAPMSPQPSGSSDDEVVFESVEDSNEWHGIHLIRVPTIEPILKEDWFLRQIKRVQAAAIEAQTEL